MCGIVGIIESQGCFASDENLKRMNDAIIHRGPDDEGFFTDGSVGLAMRRLSIIDIAGGHQPMSHASGAVIVFNGEIYNFRELRAQLESLGEAFQTHSDTEVLLNGYVQWGMQGLCKRLNGMFAFAVYDPKKQVVALGRDRTGQKPLYLHSSPKAGLLFASELKSILAHPKVQPALQPSALWHYLSLQAVPEPECIIKNTVKLPPGCTCEIDVPYQKNKKITFIPYWKPEFEPKFNGSREEAKERLRSLAMESVKRRMISDVPIGAFLSGGIDSSIVTALMQQQSSQPVKTFTIGFEEAAFDEREHARAVSDAIGTEHHEEVISWNVADSMQEIANYLDEPLADPAALPTYHLSRMTRQHVTVALNGDGGDETHAGYQRHLLDRWLWPVNRVSGSRLGDAISGLLGATLGRLPTNPNKPPEKDPIVALSRLQRAFHMPPAASLMRWSSYFTEQDKADLIEPDWIENAKLRPTDELFQKAIKGLNVKGDLDRILAADLKMYLASVLLVKADRMTMAASLEGRSPFLDPEHLQFAFSLPDRFRHQGRNQKTLLKEAFADLLPNAISKRPKQGFALPIGKWFREDLREMNHDLLLSSQSLSRGIFQPKQLRQLVRDHESGKKDCGKKLYALLMLELWFQKYQIS